MYTSNEIPNQNLESVVGLVIERINNQHSPIDNRELIGLRQKYVKILITVDPHICHEIAETSLNLRIKRKYAKSF